MPYLFRPKEYDPNYFKDEKFLEKFTVQRDDAKNYFINYIKPRLDRSYKLYTSYNGDRAKEIEKWQANVFVPYTAATVETMMPRIMDARPDFTAKGRNPTDQSKGLALQQVQDYTWEISNMDEVSEDLVRTSMVYGTSYLGTVWKKDVREQEFLKGKDINGKKNWKKEKRTFYDAPWAYSIDPYTLWYDWRNIPRASKQFWFERAIMNGAEIKRAFPDADPYRLELALKRTGDDLNDYGSIRFDTKMTHSKIVRGADWRGGTFGDITTRYQNNHDPDLRFHVVFRRWRPFEDRLDVEVNDVPILKDREMPNPYDHKEVPIIDIPFLRLPFEFEGMGYPLILEQPQVMLNMLKNQRLDAVTMGIFKMWIVSPMANVKKEQLVARPMGIIWSQDPNGVRPVEFSDVKASAYQEEEATKADMRYASGVDDFSMGVGADNTTATATRHLRESTLERVRLFVNHLGSAYSRLMRLQISMYGQFMTEKMRIRITDEATGEDRFTFIDPDDLRGEFDFKATVVPSIAGKSDVERKQAMDLFQLLIQMPFIDPKKLTGKVLYAWDWDINTVSKEEGAGQPGAEGQMPMVGPDGKPIPPELAAMMGGQGMPQAQPQQGGGMPTGNVPPQLLDQLVQALGNGQGMPQGASPFAEASRPIGLNPNPDMPLPTPQGANPRGLNRGGGVDTNIPMQRGTNDIATSEMNKASSLQLKKR